AASRLRKYYSRKFYRELASLSPLRFHHLKLIHIEKRLWSLVQKHWFD
ncbi:unnamed protein product, partial [Rotaria sordida]